MKIEEIQAISVVSWSFLTPSSPVSFRVNYSELLYVINKVRKSRNSLYLHLHLHNTLCIYPSLNTQSCIRRPLCCTLKFENLPSPKKLRFFMFSGSKKIFIKKVLCNFQCGRYSVFDPQNMKKLTSKVAYNRPPTFFSSTGPAAQMAQKQKSRTPKSPLTQDWVFRLGYLLNFNLKALLFLSRQRPPQLNSKRKYVTVSSLLNFWIYLKKLFTYSLSKTNTTTFL